ncbi:MAG: hypothetical protein ACE5G7_06900 [Candidatus Hydrothermarchaeaceae archaeon]
MHKSLLLKLFLFLITIAGCIDGPIEPAATPPYTEETPMETPVETTLEPAPETTIPPTPIPTTTIPPTTPPPTPQAREMSFEDSHFGFMHPEQSYEEAAELNVHWSRPHPGPFVWHEVEVERGRYDWRRADEFVKRAQSYEFNLLATIWPFADWDQANCRTMLPRDKAEDFMELGKYRSRPCDMVAYEEFVKKVVERYDGDGYNDMPGLLYPIKYWEVSNEPSMQEELVFFNGLPEDYFDVLKTTYLAVKEADPNAIVLHGGIAGFGGDGAEKFWQRVLDLGGSNYFDIANHHSIGDGEDIHIPAMKAFLNKNGVSKPMWMPELEFAARGLGRDRISEDEWAEILVKTFVYAFGEGEDKLFYVGLDLSPGDPESWFLYVEKSGYTGEMGPKKKQAPFYAFRTMVEKIDYFTEVEKMAVGQYKFTVDGASVYVLWGSGSLPQEIAGKVRVTDINGNEKDVDASSVVLTGSPIFVETASDG